MLSDNSVDLTVTSPPYDNLRYYNGAVWDYKKVARELYRVTKDGGVVVWIVNDATINGSETGTSFKQALYFKEIGFNLHDTMIWQKCSAYQHKNRYIPCFEYMFVFSKGKPKTVNLIKDRKNKYANIKIHGTERMFDGKMKPLSKTQKSKTVKEYGSRFNIWDIPGERHNTSGHPAVFPLQLAADHITTWSNEGDLVLDPFVGSGTTAVAASQCHRNYVGFEICKEYFKIAFDRIERERYGE